MKILRRSQFVPATQETGSHVIPVKIECDCGAIFEIHVDEEECQKCQRIYNLFGTQLAPRSQWDYDLGGEY